MVGGQVFNKPVLMKQANQDKWVSNYEAWQLKITRFTVRQIGGLIGWLNVLQLTNFISDLATNLVDPFLAWVTASYIEVDNAKLPVSFINDVDPAFGVPIAKECTVNQLYSPQDFPFDPKEYDVNGLHEFVAHFLCLAIKVSYEQAAIVEHVVTSKWGWKYIEHIETDQQPQTASDSRRLKMNVLDQRNTREADKLRTVCVRPKSIQEQLYSAQVAAKLIPDTNAFLMTNKHAVVLFFRGTEPAKLLEWWSDADLDLVKEEGVIHGSVHAGFYEALFYPLLDTQHSVFQKICLKLVAALKDNNKKLFITGHSLGAALTSVFSHVLASLSTEAQARFPGPRVNIKIKVPGVESLFSRIGAVYTFAGPLAGDRDFAAFMVDMYGNSSKRKMFRINHSSDIVPKVPPPILGYRHHPLEYFLTYDGFMYSEPQDIELWKLVELILFDRLYRYKLWYDWNKFAPDGANALGQNEAFVCFRRCAWHTVLRLYFWTGGFFFLFPIQGIMRYIPDHWPSEYEVKLRVMAEELYVYKSTAGGPDRAALPSHLLTRTRPESPQPHPTQAIEE
ncbi:MAG: hypothetical protein FRX49_10881 [Trebouxia sp. A1-2]|nr:MAG: hypothetical protein FRX49_10881 [Trebouxia sp. A1-2]